MNIPSEKFPEDTDKLPELSIVMPCLNEADTLATCIATAARALSEHRIAGEIIVVDNGSMDGSQDIAEKLNARLVNVRERGYGSALMGGIDAAPGEDIVLGDADPAMTFSEIPKFVEKLRQGFDFVQGCRLQAGGGQIVAGAMPWLHRVWGNPMFSFLARWWFQSPIHDVYCGMRAFRKDTYYILDQRCTGMEFATEMIIKASLYKAKIAEVPITLHPDGRKRHAPHLRTFRDGWRTIRFFFICTPRWLFLVPGLLLILLGMAGYAIAMPALTLKGVTFDAHTLLFASLAILCGYQSVVFAVFTKTFAISEGLLPEDPRMNRFFELANLERGVGCFSVRSRRRRHFALSRFQPMEIGRLWAPGLCPDHALGRTRGNPHGVGIPDALSSFFISILGMRRR